MWVSVGRSSGSWINRTGDDVHPLIIGTRWDQETPDMELPRASGILLHPTSLPGRFGIGDLGPEAHAFLDFLAETGQTLVADAAAGAGRGYGDSPYQSSFLLRRQPSADQSRGARRDGWLTPERLQDIPPFPTITPISTRWPAQGGAPPPGLRPIPARASATSRLSPGIRRLAGRLRSLQAFKDCSPRRPGTRGSRGSSLGTPRCWLAGAIGAGRRDCFTRVRPVCVRDANGSTPRRPAGPEGSS